ncbi:hypothetical protein [Phytohabitans rumicis]|uniref:Uncharacterized protein n=1 Tax=Phytohabitans rumicis TaxID=1076125 RepID=A0A6V8LDK5_9ACTN|nr:hypothetical protein [Phytohabitans rumicis]GFJ93730.1 hypothetical protein Prum_073720 [Phytohabitans rumicis]
MGDSLGHIVINGLPSLVTALATLTLGWFVGNRVTAKWDLTRKHREQDLATVQSFYAAYGDFFGIWKEWDGILRDKFPLEDRQALRHELYRRSCTADARVETMIMKIATERTLNNDDIHLLGCFRQAYQTLRKSIQNDRPIGVATPSWYQPSGQLLDSWDSSGSPSYEAFKLLTARVAGLLALPAVPPGPDEIALSITLITDNRFEPPVWVGEARHLLGLQPAADKLLRKRVAF